MNPNDTLPLSRWSRALVCASVLCSAAAHALPNDKEQEIHILAKMASASQKEGIVIYSGDVQLTQGSLQITADKVTLRTDANQKVETMVAEGSPARYQQQPEVNKPVIHAEATTIRYVVSKEHLSLDKNAFIEQNGATTKGGRVDYNIKSGTVSASGEGQQSGLVEFVIPPQIDKDKKD